MKISKEADRIDKEILDLSFINKFTRSQIENEIKRQEKLFPAVLKPQDNAIKLSEEEEELKHQLQLNPNLFKLPNFDNNSRIFKNNYYSRTSSPKVVVQAPAFMDTSRNGQKIKDINYTRNFQSEPHIYQKNLDNLSNSIKDLNLSNVMSKN